MTVKKALSFCLQSQKESKFAVVQVVWYNEHLTVTFQRKVEETRFQIIKSHSKFRVRLYHATVSFPLIVAGSVASTAISELKDNFEYIKDTIEQVVSDKTIVRLSFSEIQVVFEKI